MREATLTPTVTLQLNAGRCCTGVAELLLSSMVRWNMKRSRLEAYQKPRWCSVVYCCSLKVRLYNSGKLSQQLFFLPSWCLWASVNLQCKLKVIQPDVCSLCNQWGASWDERCLTRRCSRTAGVSQQEISGTLVSVMLVKILWDCIINCFNSNVKIT